MSIHPRDKLANNPRLQCTCCGRWKRLRRAQRSERGDDYNFFGGCSYTKGDHLAGKASADGYREVCTDCCATECARLACEVVK